jgi:hypothetical protein
MNRNKDKGYMRADEFHAMLEADPEWVRQRDERAAKHAAEVAKLWAEMEPEHAPIRRDLAALGLPVSSISELLKVETPYPKAVPVLVHHLQTATHPVLRSTLARSLTTDEARGIAGGPVLRELKRESDEKARFAMANALAFIATPAEADGIQALLDDPAYADVHDRLQQAMKNIRRDQRRAAKAAAPPPAPKPWWRRF